MSPYLSIYLASVQKKAIWASCKSKYTNCILLPLYDYLQPSLLPLHFGKVSRRTATQLSYLSSVPGPFLLPPRPPPPVTFILYGAQFRGEKICIIPVICNDHCNKTFPQEEKFHWANQFVSLGWIFFGAQASNKLKFHYRSICMYVCMYVFMYVCMYLCMYVCIYICMYVCMYTI